MINININIDILFTTLDKFFLNKISLKNLYQVVNYCEIVRTDSQWILF